MVLWMAELLRIFLIDKSFFSVIIDNEFQNQKEENMSKEMGIFIDFLKRRGLKLTRQREEIFKIFLSTDRHLSVEELYHIIKKRDPGVGQATVFRTLKLLSEAEMAKEVDLGDKRIRYEPKYGHSHHDHLVCVKCGRFIEVVDAEIERLQERLCRKFTFLPQRHRMEIFGICKRCRVKAG